MQTRAPRTARAPRASSLRRRARPARRPATLKKRIKTLFTLAGLAILLPLVFGGVYGITVFYQVSKTLPSLAEIGNFKPSEGTRIYYADGPVLAVLATENRKPIKLQEMGQHLIDATIATEDSRFYEHKGVDFYGVARAIVRNVSGHDLTGQGASTITQQLARNINELGLTREKKLRRKVAEAILAMRIEQSFSKEEILELYLNQIYYGNGAYGAEAASECYFHKPCRKLSVEEAATLAGIPQRPSVYSENKDALQHRRDWVLARMLETRKITREQYDAAVERPPHVFARTAPRGNQVYGAPYFVNYVVAQLERAYGPDAVYSGWQIHTTLDSRIQKAAEQALREGIGSNDYGANQACLIALEPKTGHIRAMVGGMDFKANSYNAAVQGRRQPGSSFKPIVYTAAIDTGVCDLDSTYRDDPYFKGRHPGNDWLPENYGGGYSGRSKTVRTAIQFSINTIAVKVAMETGLGTVIQYAQRMGIQSPLAKYPPLALGASAVRPIELCSAYSVFANDGKRCIPMAVTRVQDARGEDLGDSDFLVRTEDTGIKPGTLQQMNEALRNVVQNGTGTAASDVPNACGKTGTTSDNRDAWFAGYTPELTAVIWAGREHRSKRTHKVDAYEPMDGATGGHLCAPIWRNFMLKAVPIQQAVNKAARAATEPPKPPAEGQEKHKPTTPKPGQPAAGAEGQMPGATTTAGAPEGLLPGTAGTAPTPSQPNPAAPGPLATPSTSSGAQATPAGGAVVRPAGVGPAPRPSDTGGRPSPPVTRANPDDEMVTVNLCADTMRRATEWCPATLTRRMPRRSVPGYCRAHRPPPGER